MFTENNTIYTTGNYMRCNSETVTRARMVAFTTEILSQINDKILTVLAIHTPYFSMRSFCDGPLEFARDANCCFTFAIFLRRNVNIT